MTGSPRSWITCADTSRWTARNTRRWRCRCWPASAVTTKTSGGPARKPSTGRSARESGSGTASTRRSRRPDSPRTPPLTLAGSPADSHLRLGPGEALEDEVLDAGGVGLAAGGLHHGPDEGTGRRHLAGPDLRGHLGIARDGLVHRGGERAVVADHRQPAAGH